MSRCSRWRSEPRPRGSGRGGPPAVPSDLPRRHPSPQADPTPAVELRAGTGAPGRTAVPRRPRGLGRRGGNRLCVDSRPFTLQIVAPPRPVWCGKPWLAGARLAVRSPADERVRELAVAVDQLASPLTLQHRRGVLELRQVAGEFLTSLPQAGPRAERFRLAATDRASHRRAPPHKARTMTVPQRTGPARPPPRLRSTLPPHRTEVPRGPWGTGPAGLGTAGAAAAGRDGTRTKPPRRGSGRRGSAYGGPRGEGGPP